MRYFYLGCGIIVMMLAGCTQANTVGQETNKELDNQFTNHGGGTFIVYSPVTVYASTANESGQTTDNDPAQSINPATSLGMEGGTSSLAAEGADMALKGISSLMDNKKTPKPVSSPETKAAKESAVPAVPSTDDSVTSVEYGEYYGRHNGDRPHWYFSKPMKDYPVNFTVVIDGCDDITVTDNNGVRFDPGTGEIVKQSDVSGREMVVLSKSSCQSERAYIKTEDSVTLDMKESGDRSYAWLDKNGSEYDHLDFSFDNGCGNFSVSDPEKSVGEDGLGKDGIYYLSGNDFSEGDIEYNDGRASIFTAHGCIASKVEINYVTGG